MKIIFRLLVLFICISGYAQRVGQQRTLKQETALLERPHPVANKILLPENTVVTIDSVSKLNSRYFFVTTTDDKSGYIHEMWFKNRKPVEPNEVLDSYRRRFGEPDEITNYYSRTTDFKTQTWIWHCSNGRYRSITFKWERVEWIKGSESTSDGIR